MKVFNKVGVQAFLTMNQKQPPFNNVKARQALLYLVNQAGLYAGQSPAIRIFWQVCWAYLMCNSPAGTEVGAEMHKTPDLGQGQGASEKRPVTKASGSFSMRRPAFRQCRRRRRYSRKNCSRSA